MLSVPTPQRSTESTASKPTPKRGRARASIAAQSPKREKKALQPLDIRPASFLTSSKTSSFLTKAIPTPPTKAKAGPSLQPRVDIWSYVELNGLAWIRLDTESGGICQRGKQDGCWWPAEIEARTPTVLKLILCGLKTVLEVEPSALDETNVLTFRPPGSSSVRFPTFKSAYSPRSTFVPPEASSPLTPTNLTPPPTNQPTTSLPTDPIALETIWKSALTRAFEIDAESNDGLEDIFLLVSQKSKGTRDDATSGSGETALEEEEDEGEKTDEGDILEEDTTVLCRYRTRFYPAKVVTYLPREGKRRRGRYQCRFADDSTKIASRADVLTTLDEGFVTCPLGSYQRYVAHAGTSDDQLSHKAPRAPTPDPRPSSPAPEPSDTKIDPTEYCARERMRDQLKSVLPFLQGIIERTYAPAQGQGRGDEGAEVLDRHAVFMQGGRARKNLAYSVHTGDLNEDDCEELMFEVSRWALRGERWASGRDLEMDVDSCEHDHGGEQEGKDREGNGSREKGSEGQEEGGKKGEAPSGVKDGGEQEEGGSGVAIQTGMSEQDVEMKDVEAADGSTSEAQETPEKAKPEQESENLAKVESKPELKGDKQAVEDEDTDATLSNAFHRLVQLQPPRPIGAADYEGLTPEERMGYVSDVLYPEAAAFILSYRRGTRTQPGPLPDLTAEYKLYTAGIELAKNAKSKEDWVERILAVRQLREMNAKYGVEEETQIVVPGGTRSRPKYMLSKTSSAPK